ncbi:MAG: hypothetical protein JW841_05065 [Deltaproteobacteria bacterium]|nr:hypothetical protein [Deltaproteobacteria bacterium]
MGNSITITSILAEYDELVLLNQAPAIEEFALRFPKFPTLANRLWDLEQI